MQEYRFRAEGMPDAMAFLSMPGVCTSCNVEPLSPSMPIDVLVTFKSSKPLHDIRAMLRDIPNGHVMAETVHFSELYTGER